MEKQKISVIHQKNVRIVQLNVKQQIKKYAVVLHLQIVLAARTQRLAANLVKINGVAKKVKHVEKQKITVRVQKNARKALLNARLLIKNLAVVQDPRIACAAKTQKNAAKQVQINGAAKKKLLVERHTESVWNQENALMEHLAKQKIKKHVVVQMRNLALVAKIRKFVVMLVQKNGVARILRNVEIINNALLKENVAITRLHATKTTMNNAAVRDCIIANAANLKKLAAK